MAIAGLVKVWPRHLYVRVVGDILNSSTLAPIESFSFGIRCGSMWRGAPAGDGGHPLEEAFHEDHAVTYLTTRAVPAVRTFFATNLISKFVKVTKISANVLINDGGSAKYEYPRSNEVYPGVTAGIAAIAGGATQSDLSNMQAPQVSVVVSTRTALQRGPAAKGRFYLPPIYVTMGPNWRLTSSHQQALSTSAKALLTGLQWQSFGVSSQEAVVPAVVSPTSHLNSGQLPEGVVQPITSVRVGDVFDTMRSRRAQMAESYTTDTIIMPA